MILKKINALTALLTILTLFLHVGYSVYEYLTFYYNPGLVTAFSLLLLSTMCLHAVLGMSVVFLQGDGTKLDLYPRQNLRTVIQRLTAAFIFPLLILHMKTYSLMKTSSEDGMWAVFVLLIVAQICFYGVIITHAAVSMTPAFITLGWLSSRKMQKQMDRVIYIICAVVFLVATVSVIRTQLIMFTA